MSDENQIPEILRERINELWAARKNNITFSESPAQSDTEVAAHHMLCTLELGVANPKQLADQIKASLRSQHQPTSTEIVVEMLSRHLLDELESVLAAAKEDEDRMPRRLLSKLAESQ